MEIPLDGDFPEFIEFTNEKNVVIRQKVLYEWKPLKCAYCKMYGHIQEDCRKKPQQRREWRAVEAPRCTTSTPDQEKGEGDDFQLATRHISRKSAQQITEVAPDDLLQVNLYNALLEDEGSHDYEEGRGNGGGLITPHG